MARQSHPALVAIDAMLHGADAWRVLGALRSDPDLSSISVLLKCSVGGRTRGIVCHADGCLLKPVEESALAQVFEATNKEHSSALIISPDVETRQHVRRMLETQQLRVVESKSYRTPIQLLNDPRCAAIFLDVQPPEFEALHCLLRWRSQLRVPVILMAPKNVSGAEKAGLFDCLAGLEGGGEQGTAPPAQIAFRRIEAEDHVNTTDR